TSNSLSSSPFLLPCYVHLLALPSFPTRRSSDLVARIDSLRVFVNVPQAYAPNVTVGLPVLIAVRGQLGQPVMGKVTRTASAIDRSEEHTSELQSRVDLVCRLLLEKKKYIIDVVD